MQHVPKILVFNFGSNGTAQLRARVRNPSLALCPATAKDLERVFCRRSQGWGGGGVASLAPSPGALTRGSVAELTPQEMELLETYEGGYRKVTISVCISKGGDANEEIETPALAFIAGSGVDGWTDTLEVPPSEEYLVAIHVHLREHWDLSFLAAIVINSFEAGGIRRHGEWSHPGTPQLKLESLIVEANARRPGSSLEPWIVPRCIAEMVGKLRAEGIEDTPALHRCMNKEYATRELNEALVAKGHTILCPETVAIFRDLAHRN